MFFSFPLLLPYLINRLVPRGLQPSNARIDARMPKLPRISLQLTSIIIMLLVVHYNTNVHPFTLADNRHYMFYVFRLLLRHPLIKYAAVPVYFFSALATISAFSGVSHLQGNPRPRIPDSARMEHNLRYKLPPPPEVDPPGASRISFVLVWLLATTLSLVTAPLVEPRYFIVPWILWRIHVHTASTKNSTYQARKKSDRKRKGSWLTLNQAIQTLLYSNRNLGLWLETAWFLFINWATAYIFLYWGFEWPQEPGKVQRFMW
jgi:alpha-1,2-glucosyltransferase